MSPAMIFVVPTVMAVVLALASGAAYRHTRREYLLWWTGVWVISTVYYLAIMSLVLAGQSQADPFSQFGLVTTVLGWLRGASYWAGARVFVGRPIGRPFYLGVVVVTVILAGMVVGTPFGQRSPAATTRLTFVVWFFIAAAELLRQRPRTAVGSLCAASLLLLGIQGTVASQMSLDLTGALTSGWISTALSTALGLGVLGRTLEEEREIARARSVELGAANTRLAETNSQLAEANARLAELDQLKNDFVSMVSHELRTPLGLIKGYAGTLLREEISLDEATRREFLVVIDDETDRLTELVTNLLDMSRIEAGTPPDRSTADRSRRSAEGVRAAPRCTRARSRTGDRRIGRAAARPGRRAADRPGRRQSADERGALHAIRHPDPVAGAPRSTVRDGRGGGSRSRHPGREARADLREVHQAGRRRVARKQRHGPRARHLPWHRPGPRGHDLGRQWDRVRSHIRIHPAPERGTS